ncbi:MAG: hypothetical protein ACOY0T_10745 [Myxococcota bacterium]
MLARQLLSLVLLGLTLAAIGCVPSNTRLSQYIEESHQLQCPPDEIRVLSQRRVGSDELFAVEACGRRIEVEYGLEFPKQKNAVSVVNEQEAQELQSSLPLTVAPAQIEAAREKAKDYCVLGPPPAAQDQLAIYNATPEALLECRARVASGTVALGADRDRDNARREWFRVLNWAFPARTGAHVPACTRLALDDSEEACACQAPEQRSAACTQGAPALADANVAPSNAATPGDQGERARSRSRARRGSILYGRSGIGFGYLSSKASGMPTFTSVTFDIDASAGLRFSPYFAAGIEGAFRMALAQQTYDLMTPGISGQGNQSVRMFEGSLFGTWFPGGADVHLDAYAGLCALRRATPNEDTSALLTGAIFGVGAGWLGRGEYLDFGFGGRVYTASASPSSNYGGSLLFEMAVHSRASDATEAE